MYVTRGVDEESSVEEDEEEEWNGSDNDVGYLAQTEQELDEDETEVAESKTPQSTGWESEKIVNECATFDTAALVAKEELERDRARSQASMKPRKTSKTRKSISVPLIRPPPEEKLKKWQDHKERQSKHLESLRQGKK